MASPGWQIPSAPAADKIAAQSAGDATMKISHQTLQVLQNAGQFVPIPGIGIAATVALSILTVVQTMKDNKEAFLNIGKDACTIVVTVVQRVNLSATGQAPSINEAVLQRDAEELLDQMKAIEKCVKKHIKKRGLVKRLVFSQSDQETVQECQRRLQRALNLFGLQSDLEMRKQLAELSAQMKELIEHQKLSHGPQMPNPQTQIPQPQPQAHIPQPQPQMSPPQNSQSIHVSAPQMPQMPQFPSPSFTPSQPSSSPSSPNQVFESREDRKAARRAKKEARIARAGQQSIDVTGTHIPSDSTFQNVQNHIHSGANVTYHSVSGDVVHNVRDDSFNVGGTGNSINISFVRQ